MQVIRWTDLLVFAVKTSVSYLTYQNNTEKNTNRFYATLHMFEATKKTAVDCHTPKGASYPGTFPTE